MSTFATKGRREHIGHLRKPRNPTRCPPNAPSTAWWISHARLAGKFTKSKIVKYIYLCPIPLKQRGSVDQHASITIKPARVIVMLTFHLLLFFSSRAVLPYHCSMLWFSEVFVYQMSSGKYEWHPQSSDAHTCASDPRCIKLWCKLYVWANVLVLVCFRCNKLALLAALFCVFGFVKAKIKWLLQPKWAHCFNFCLPEAACRTVFTLRLLSYLIGQWALWGVFRWLVDYSMREGRS